MEENNILSKNNIKSIIIHCSDTPNDQQITAIDIHKMHLAFGWDGIGYHKIIRRDGLIENGRPEYWIGAHVKGKNKETLGVCLIGKNNFTKNQFVSLEEVIVDWKQKYNISQILGHRDIVKTNKTCPNFSVYQWCIKRGLF